MVVVKKKKKKSGGGKSPSDPPNILDLQLCLVREMENVKTKDTE